MRLADYRMWLESETRSVELGDPLGALVAGFARELHSLRASGPPEPDPRITGRMEMLETLVVAFRDQGGH